MFLLIFSAFCLLCMECWERKGGRQAGREEEKEEVVLLEDVTALQFP